ncbi:hypothetical protein Pst134EA_032224 [Puccinia striiformis f. sp. tritici]|uniref:uncharacterized protein n=1 Tax=Puccinia striiformis f. sp. tritici TaxID=168172 RepID=UPI0020089969|nr:uncharacterized protein Pst134EA_032224 [Puccinia striiformis f. sp. tritici]KAH9444349.1 hypothetical protein Pst134EA_032224 [Puccinia striiformis f. sp. tritici]
MTEHKEPLLIRVRLDNLTVSSDISRPRRRFKPTSSFFDSKDLPHRLSTLQLLRSTLRTDGAEDLTPAENDNYYLGSNFYVEWNMVVYITLRDQVASGDLRHSSYLIFGKIFVLKKRKLHTRHTLESSSAPIVSKPGSIWDRVVSSIWGGVQTNTTL